VVRDPGGVVQDPRSGLLYSRLTIFLAAGSWRWHLAGTRIQRFRDSGIRGWAIQGSRIQGSV